MWILKLFVILLVVVLGASLATLNAGLVHFDYYFKIIEIPLSIVLVLTLGIGALFGVLAGMTLSLEIRRENARLRRKISVAEKEISNLRTLPLQDR